MNNKRKRKNIILNIFFKDKSRKNIYIYEKEKYLIILILLYNNIVSPQRGRRAPASRKETKRKEQMREKIEEESYRGRESEAPDPNRGN